MKFNILNKSEYYRVLCLLFCLFIFGITLFFCFWINNINIHLSGLVLFVSAQTIMLAIVLFIVIFFIPDYFSRILNSKKQYNLSHYILIWLLLFVSSFIIHYGLLGVYEYYTIIFSYLVLHLFNVLSCGFYFRLQKNDSLEKRQKTSPQPIQINTNNKNNIRLKGHLKNDNLVLLLEDLSYIECFDNYCELTYLVNGHHQTKLFRISMKELESQLKENQNLLRVHKSFILNLKHVFEFVGNINNTKAVLIQDKNLRIPISRLKRDKVIEIFNEVVRLS